MHVVAALTKMGILIGDAVNNGDECAGVDEQPAPSESERTANCPSCSAGVASPSTEPETPATTENQTQAE